MIKDSASTIVPVLTTYLHIPSRDTFRPSFSNHPELRVEEAREPLPAFYRFLYSTVGHDYFWVNRLGWSDERLLSYLSRPAVSVHVLYYRGTPAGYIELDRDSEEEGTEVAYFGLIQAVHGRGFGKHLLSVGVVRAFDQGAERVWVHTCSLDGAYALATYQSRGFQIYKTEVHEETIPAAISERMVYSVV